MNYYFPYGIFRRIMARPLRIEHPGAVYHLTARGNRQEDIFLDDADRTSFITILGKTVHRYRWICHGYCLMNNHYHLLMETPDANLSIGMRQLNGMYTQYSNRRHGKVGHVFQGRFKSILVEKEAHLLELCRYIVLNPVRAEMVARPGDWPWSSFNALARAGHCPEFLNSNWILGQFSRSKDIARKEYQAFVAEGLQQPSPWQMLSGQTLLGSDTFIKKMEGYLQRHADNPEIPKRERHVGRPHLSEVIPVTIRTDKAKRNPAIVEAHFKYGYTLKQIADLLGIHYTTVSKAIASRT